MTSLSTVLSYRQKSRKICLSSSGAMHPIEPIPGQDSGTQIVCRHLYFPMMYDAYRSLIWKKAFEFPSCQHESLAWEKYAEIPGEMHRIGMDREREKRKVRSDYRYEGFAPAAVSDLRRVRTVPGHGFAVQHMPEEGRLYHVGIFYSPAGDMGSHKLTKLERTELLLALQTTFKHVVAPPTTASNGADHS